jgi:putative hydrolase of the HAD superfamily
VSAPTAVLFDLFGTLLAFDAGALPELDLGDRRVRSTAPLWAALLDDVLPGVGIAAFARALGEVTAALVAARGDGHRETPAVERFRRAIALVRPDADATTAAPLLARAHHRGIAAATRFPEAHARVLATACARGPVGVVTNFDDTASAYEILDRHGILGRAASVVVSEAVGLRKPHPLLVEIALRELGVAPRQALFVGDDAVADVGAATAAGVDAVWIDARGGGLPAGAPSPRWVVRSLADVVALLV